RDARCGALTLRRAPGAKRPHRWHVDGGDSGDGGDKPAPRGCAREEMDRGWGETSPPSTPSQPDDLLDAAREGTGLTREQAGELLAPDDLDDLLAGRLPIEAARHYLLH